MERQYFYDIEQGTPEWKEVRCGVATASRFGDILTSGKGGKESKTRRGYLYDLAGEAITGLPAENKANAYFDRGKEWEPEARDLYALTNQVEVAQVGFVKSAGRIGCSPDGIVGDGGCIEIKTKNARLQLEVLNGDNPNPEAKHMAQIQGGLWVMGREWCDFVSYSRNLQLFTKRVYRDEKYIANLTVEVNRFLSEMHELMERINKL